MWSIENIITCICTIILRTPYDSSNQKHTLICCEKPPCDLGVGHKSKISRRSSNRKYLSSCYKKETNLGFQSKFSKFQKNNCAC